MTLFTDHELAQPRLAESTAKILVALAETGCSRDVLAALLAMDNLHDDHRRFLTGPIIQHRSPWADTTPSWLYRAAIADRVRIICDEQGRGPPGWQVGPAELTAVMYPATMDAPLAMEWSDIYLWAAAQANARHYRKSLDDIWSSLGGEPVPDRLITDPAGRYHGDYRRLCTDIRSRVVKAAARSSGRGGRAQEITPLTEQLSLFETGG